MALVISSLTYPLSASSINVVASSTGCFSAVPIMCASGGTSASVGGLTFTGRTTISGATTFDSSIGSFDLTPLPFNYNGTYFGLFLAFSAPDGQPDNDFTALVTGKINAQHNGDIRVTFDNQTITQLFNGADGSGALTVTLDQTQYNLNPAAGRNHAEITAGISGTLNETAATTTPEPGTLLLFGGGAVLMMLGRLKRLRWNP
jgi:hypothetical protein